MTGSATGFEAGETVSIAYGPALPPRLAGRCTADSTGSCVVNFDAPGGQVGPTTITAQGLTSGFRASAVFTETPGPASLSLNPTSGPTGTAVTVTVAGFAASETVQLSFNGSVAGSCVTRSSTGECFVTVVVPSVSAGNYDVSATDATGLNASATFTVIQSVSLSPSAGPAGTTLSATAAGFEAGETVDVSYDSSSVGSCIADQTGSCPVSFTVPSEPEGPYSVAATGTTSGLEAQATFIDAGPASLALSPTTGIDGLTFTASASGFEPDEEVDVSYTPVIGYTLSSFESCTTDGTGACSVNFPGIPDQPAGSLTVTAVGATSGLEATAIFAETPALETSPDDGLPGSKLYLGAYGFAASTTVAISFDGLTVGSCSADANGDCTATVVVPAVPAGDYDVVATDPDGNSATRIFTVPVVPALSLDTPSGPAGTTLTATAYGFDAGETVNMSYDSSIVGSCVADSSGTCSVVFGVPSENAGLYAITATGGTSRFQATASFSEIPTFVISPTSGFQGSAVGVSVGQFGANEVVNISFDEPSATPVGSCLTDTSGDCSTEVVIPSVPAGTYYVSASGSSSGDFAPTQFEVLPGPQSTTTTLSSAPSANPSPYGQPVTFTATVSPTDGGGSVDFSDDGLPVPNCSNEDLSLVTGEYVASCAISSLPAGTDTIAANYGGDSDYSNSEGSLTQVVIGPPAIDGLAPASGAPGVAVVITGSNLENATAVTFHGVAAKIKIDTATSIKVKVPAGATTGKVNVVTLSGKVKSTTEFVVP